MPSSNQRQARLDQPVPCGGVARLGGDDQLALDSIGKPGPAIEVSKVPAGDQSQIRLLLAQLLGQRTVEHPAGAGLPFDRAGVFNSESFRFRPQAHPGLPQVLG